MSNADKPAIQSVGIDCYGDVYHSDDLGGIGLTKLEHFCLAMGVPETGDDDLNEIIRKGNYIKLTAMMMQGLLGADHQTLLDICNNGETLPEAAVKMANGLLKQLEKNDERK